MIKELTYLIPIVGWWNVAGRLGNEPSLLEQRREINFKTLIKETLKEVSYYGLIGLYNVAILSTLYKLWYDSLPIQK